MSTGVDLSQFYDMFFDEAEELLTEMEQLLLELDVAKPNRDHLNGIFRAAHSIKGGAGTFGCFPHLAETTHLLENILDYLRNDELALRKDMIDLFLDAKDVLTEQLGAYRNGTEPDAQAYERICQQLRQLAQEAESVATENAAAPAAEPLAEAVTEVAPPPVAPSTPQAEPALAPADAAQVLKVHLTGLDEADREALEAEMAIMGTIIDKQLADGNLTLWLDTTVDAQDIKAVCSFIANENQIGVEAVTPAAPEPEADDDTELTEPAEATPQAGQEPPSGQEGDGAQDGRGRAAPRNTASSNTLRVGVEKVDQIINLVGELVITQAMLVQTVAGMDPVQHDRLVQSVEQLRRNARELQEAVMSIRMMPMDYVFSRFPRVVRENAAAMGKSIRLVTHGQATEERGR